MVTNAVELMAPQPAQLKGLAATSLRIPIGIVFHLSKD